MITGCASLTSLVLAACVVHDHLPRTCRISRDRAATMSRGAHTRRGSCRFRDALGNWPPIFPSLSFSMPLRWPNAVLLLHRAGGLISKLNEIHLPPDILTMSPVSGASQLLLYFPRIAQLTPPQVNKLSDHFLSAFRLSAVYLPSICRRSARVFASYPTFLLPIYR
jgi:hypothetical protein